MPLRLILTKRHFFQRSRPVSLIYDLLLKARSCRRFKGDSLSSDFLASLVDCARISPCARNEQVLKFATISDPSLCEQLNDLIVLGGALKPEQRAKAHQHPRGFIVIMGPENKQDFIMMDLGIAAQSIHLAAAEAGIDSCMIIVINKKEASKLLNIPQGLDIYMIIALGKADEERRIVSPSSKDNIGYYRDQNDVHCVPKRSLEDILIICR